MQEHLRTDCRRCRREHAAWEAVAATLAADRAAASRRQKAASLWPSRAQIGAWLEFDNFALAGAGALRGDRGRRHLIYRLRAADGRELSLEVMVERTGAVEEWSVVGQVLGAWRGGEVIVSRGLDAQERATPDELGEFSFSRTDTGPWDLRLQERGCDWGEVRVLMP